MSPAPITSSGVARYDVLGGKTGFITARATASPRLLRLPQTGQQVAVVVLGAKSNQGRFWETRHLFNWMTSHAQKLLGIAQPPVPPTEGLELVYE